MDDPGDVAENLFFFFLKPSEPEVLDVSLQENSGNWTSVNLVIKFPIWNASSSIYNILSLRGGSPVENQQFGSRREGLSGQTLVIETVCCRQSDGLGRVYPHDPPGGGGRSQDVPKKHLIGIPASAPQTHSWSFPWAVQVVFTSARPPRLFFSVSACVTPFLGHIYFSWR